MKEKYFNKIEAVEDLPNNRYTCMMVDKDTGSISRIVDPKENIRELVSVLRQKNQILRLNVISEDELSLMQNS